MTPLLTLGDIQNNLSDTHHLYVVKPVRRRRLIQASGGVLFGMAGCLRLSQGDEGDSSTTRAPPTERQSTSVSPATETTSPEDQTETTPVSPEDVPYPTGLSEDGVDEFLYATHTRALRGTSFRAKWTKLDKTNSRFLRDKEYRAEFGTALGSWVRIGGGKVDIYRADNEAFWRENLGDRYTYGHEQDGYDLHWIAWGEEIEPFLAVGDWSAPEIIDESRPVVWEVTTSSPTSETPVPGYQEGGTLLSISSASMTIDENGIIRSLDAQYRIDNPGPETEEIAFESIFTLDGLGDDISIDEPSWVATAKNQIPRVSASLSADRKFVRFVIESDDRIEAGSSVAIRERGRDDNRFYVDLTEPIEPGVPVYMYKTNDDSRVVPGALSRGEPPADASPVALSESYEIFARRRTTTIFSPVDVSPP